MSPPGLRKLSHQGARSMRTHGREHMRILAPHSRLRVLLLAFTLLAIIPAAANAAPKKVRFSFSTAAASVDEGAGTYNLTILRSLNKNVSAQVRVDLTGTAGGGGTDYSFTNPGTITFAP